VRILSDDGFTVTELLVTSVIMLLVVGGALTTFQHALDINDMAGQIGDANQNLRAGSNQLIKDLMMAGRVIAADGIPIPNGGGASAIRRPGPPGMSLTFSLVADDDGNLELPAITPGYQLGPTVNGASTDVVTILTVDGFMPVIQGLGSGTPTGLQGVIAADGSKMTLPTTSPWLVGDTASDTPPIAVGDLVLFKNANGMAIQTVTSVTSTAVLFASGDWFNFNQRNAAYNGTVYCIKLPDGCNASASFPNTAVLRLLMITYYVDNTTTPGTPRLTRILNHGTAIALAGVVEDLDLTYDLVDSSSDAVANVPSLPYTLNGITYTSQMIKKVNVHLGVRSEGQSKVSQDYVRNHINTAVDVRSLASVDRYSTQ
jgi:hypothetical protein